MGQEGLKEGCQAGASPPGHLWHFSAMEGARDRLAGHGSRQPTRRNDRKIGVGHNAKSGTSLGFPRLPPFNGRTKKSPCSEPPVPAKSARSSRSAFRASSQSASNSESPPLSSNGPGRKPPSSPLTPTETSHGCSGERKWRSRFVERNLGSLVIADERLNRRKRGT